MYKIMVDGQEVYSPALSNDLEHQILSPSLQLEIDTAGSLSFTLPPGHKEYDSFHKLKSVVTMEWDGVEIFRGRVLEEKTDAYNQKEIYCEGDLSLLLDSVQRPFKHESITKRAFIEQAIASHNEQVEEYKRFALGDFSALTDDAAIPLESDGYADTLSAIRAVLETHEGYLFTRYENGTRYLDFLTTHRANTGQTIEFGVNLVDLDNQTAAGELCTVLLPIGGMLEDGTTVTIASVNGGKDTIEDAAAIAQYGRIVKTYAFDDITDPAELLKLAQEKLASMAITETLILKAVDMHLLDESKGIILPGIPVLIHTTPHGFDNQRKLCTALDLDPDNPEDATYTFGKPEKTQSGAAALIASKVEKHTRSVEKLWKHYDETDYTVKIHAGLLDSQSKYISEALFELDGINAKILTATGEIERVDGKIDSEIAAITGSAIWQDRDKIVSAVGEIDMLGSNISTITGSALWQNRDKIVGAVGEIAAIEGDISTITGSALWQDRDKIVGAVGEIDTIESDIQGITSDISTITGSALWQNRASITGVVGKMTVGNDGTIYIQEGSGLKVYKGGVAYGLYDENNLTAGLLVQKLNGSTTAKIKAERIDLEGYVTAADLETYMLEVLENANFMGNIWVEGTVYAGYVNAAEISGSVVADTVTIGGEAAATQAWVDEQKFATQSWVSGRGYATQSWVNNQGFATVGEVNTQTNGVYNWVLENYPTKSWVNAQNYLTRGALTTKEITVVTSVNTTKATIASGFTYVSNVTYNTTKHTIVTFA